MFILRPKISPKGAEEVLEIITKKLKAVAEKKGSPGKGSLYEIREIQWDQ
jgi:hypothetical protein